jgi:flavin reductase (DIM6/NTAB) family NADH-FMN oxidoreductase RutF
MADGDPTLAHAFTRPVYIATACADGLRAGCLVGFATQVSIDPERFLVCISRANATFPVAMAAERLGVHAVTEGERGLAELFGGETGDEIDKFARCAWHEGPERLPILDDLPNWFAGRILHRLGDGDHDVIVLEPLAAERQAEEEELTFHRAKRIEPGHAP